GLNRLEGKALKSDDFGKPQAHLANWFLYSFIFAVGLVTISLEIILVRLVSLTIGSGVYVFPIVLGIVVLGIALGSLSIHNREIKTHTLLHRSLIGAGLLIFAFVTVPYWPTLVSHIRVSLVSIPSNHFVFLTFVFALLSIFLFLPFYFMGQLLPLSYAYIEKDKNNYGRICGNLYFFNTIGTVVGAVVIGYWLLHFLSTQQVFALDILLVIALAFIVAYLQKRYIYLVVSACLAIFLLTWPDWNRIHHEFGIFRMRTLTTSHFTGNLLFDAGPIGETLLFEDGPNSTVTIADHTPTGIEPTPKNEIVLPGPKYREISVVMNGKSDGDSHVDFGTMYMTALLPYIYADHKPNLKVAIAGFGLGITAGALARAKDVGSVEVVEISSVLSQHHALLDPVNFNFSQNNKAKIITNDAFRYLMRSKDKFDIIASEPSNPWVVGVENLFSLDFYEVAASKLNNGGLIAQWINSYDTSNEIIRMIFANLTQVFPFVRSYKVGLDFIILGSKLPFSDSALEERLQEDFFKTINQKIGFDSFAGIRALEVTNESASAFLTLRNELGFHSLQFPKLAFGSNRAFFLNERAIDDKLIDNFSSSRLLYSPNKESVLTYLQQNPLCDKANFYKMMCMQYQKIVKRYKAYRSPTSGAKALESYLWLRHFGYIDKDSEFLALLEKHLFSNPEVSEKAASLLFSAFIEDENFTRAHELVSQLKIRNQIGELEVQKFEEDLVKTKKFQEQSKNIIQGIQANLSKLNEASKSTKRVEL
ncbi:MAG: hypothetical protein KDD35_06210, partial [Bdellovibrionales bacterium]|nr:hypothetical protein [Bdellovibrionales bacterium]